MKRLIFFGIAFFGIMIITSCGGKDNNITNSSVLGELPVIANKAVNELEGLQEELEKATTKRDMEGYEKIIEKIAMIKKEADHEMDSFIQSRGIINIPFEQNVEKELYNIKEVKLTKAQFYSKPSSLESSLIMEVRCETVQEIRGNLFLFLRFIDTNDKELAGWATLNYFGKALQTVMPGETIVFNGSYSGSVEKLINVKKVINKSRDEWNERNK